MKFSPRKKILMFLDYFFSSIFLLLWMCDDGEKWEKVFCNWKRRMSVEKIVFFLNIDCE